MRRTVAAKPVLAVERADDERLCFLLVVVVVGFMMMMVNVVVEWSGSIVERVY